MRATRLPSTSRSNAPLSLLFCRPPPPIASSAPSSVRAATAYALQSGRRGSNPRHQAWKACALPAELLPQTSIAHILRHDASLHFTSLHFTSLHFTSLLARQPSPHQPHDNNGGGRIRTFEGLRRQIYSLLPLATWVPHRSVTVLPRLWPKSDLHRQQS